MKSIYLFFIAVIISVAALAQSDEFGGVGIRFKIDYFTGFAIVNDVIPRSPADYSGIKKDDIILAIDGTNTKGLEMEEIKSLIRGKVGTSVVLKMQRGEKSRDFTLKRVKMIIK